VRGKEKCIREGGGGGDAAARTILQLRHMQGRTISGRRRSALLSQKGAEKRCLDQGKRRTDSTMGGGQGRTYFDRKKEINPGEEFAGLEGEGPS